METKNCISKKAFSDNTECRYDLSTLYDELNHGTDADRIQKDLSEIRVELLERSIRSADKYDYDAEDLLGKSYILGVLAKCFGAMRELEICQ